MKDTTSPLLRVRKPNVSPVLRSTLLMGLICGSALLMVLGLYLCYTVESHQQFFIGVMVVGVGFLLISFVKDFLKGVST